MLTKLLSGFSFFNLNLELVHPECALGSWAGAYTRSLFGSKYALL